MTPETLTATLDADPFRPVELCLTDGSVVRIPTPYLTMISPNDRLYVARASREGANAAGNIELIPLSEIKTVTRAN